MSSNEFQHVNIDKETLATMREIPDEDYFGEHYYNVLVPLLDAIPLLDEPVGESANDEPQQTETVLVISEPSVMSSNEFQRIVSGEELEAAVRSITESCEEVCAKSEPVATSIQPFCSHADEDAFLDRIETFLEERRQGAASNAPANISTSTKLDEVSDMTTNKVAPTQSDVATDTDATTQIQTQPDDVTDQGATCNSETMVVVLSADDQAAAHHLALTRSSQVYFNKILTAGGYDDLSIDECHEISQYASILLDNPAEFVNARLYRTVSLLPRTSIAYTSTEVALMASLLLQTEDRRHAARIFARDKRRSEPGVYKHMHLGMKSNVL